MRPDFLARTWRAGSGKGLWDGRYRRRYLRTVRLTGSSDAGDSASTLAERENSRERNPMPDSPPREPAPSRQAP